MDKSQGWTGISTRTACLGLFLGFLVFACNSSQQPPPAPPDTRAADEAAVRKADADWATAGQSKQVDAWVAFYSNDAVVLPPNEQAASDKDSIHKTIGDLLALPGLTISWKAARVEVAKSGDLAYVQGSYDLGMEGAKGKPVSDHGKYVEVWKKQPDGSWKCALDTWNSDLPRTPPSK